jgi:thiol-disulfide isomerase/thioredoxin
MKEKVITIFRKKCSTDIDKLTEGLLAYGVDPDSVQVVINKDAPDICTFFRVNELPTVLLFSDGDEVKRLEGENITTQEMLAFLNS